MEYSKKIIVIAMVLMLKMIMLMKMRTMQWSFLRIAL